MIEINKPSITKYWIASGVGVEHTGEVGPDLVVTTGQPNLVGYDTSAERLANLNETHYPPLPEQGEPLVTGDLYSWNNLVVQVRQDHVRTEHDPDSVPALFFSVGNGQDWIPGERVEVGNTREYLVLIYRCLQSHVTQAGWEPPTTPALWNVYNPTTQWVAGEAVSIDDEREYLGLLYRCIQAHTTQLGWEPPIVPALWVLI